MYMSCTFNMFVYIVYPKFFCWGFSPPTWPKKHDISSILSGISQYQKNTISLYKSRQPEKKPFPLVIKPGMELRIFNGTIY